MPTKGPIIVIDDDQDDHEMIERVITRLNPELTVKKFFDGEDALHYLQHETEQPFLILCDINMPIMNGLELKKHIEASEFLSRKSVPFIFLTTTNNMDQVKQAYQLNAQGFFNKGQTFDELKSSLHTIIHYWTSSKHPNT